MNSNLKMIPYLIVGVVLFVFVAIIFVVENSNSTLRRTLSKQQFQIRKLEYEKNNLELQNKILKLTHQDSLLYEKIQHNSDSVRAAMDFFK
jgi:hypothetical protein